MSSVCERGQRRDRVTSGKEGWRGRLDEDGWRERRKRRRDEQIQEDTMPKGL